MKRRIVLSGVNFVEAGPLSIMQEAIEAVATSFPECEIHALVHRRDLFHTAGVTYHEYPEVKASWLRRLRFEYRDCKSISRELDPYLWLAMHDITPRVTAKMQAVYCHNPAPFYRMGWRESLLSYRFTMFALLYRYLYGFGIRRNDYVVVQQDWLRRAFCERYHPKQVVVAHPSVKPLPLSTPPAKGADAPYRFFYPAFPRSFKNVEVLLEALRQLEQSGAPAVELRLTIDGRENAYSRQLRQRFSDVRSVRWLGALTRDSVMQQYAEVDALLFPSRLETWGMPITEFRQTGKPMLVADLPYAHETVGDYPAVGFIPPDHAGAWADAIRSCAMGEAAVSAAAARPIGEPFAGSWRELFELLLR